MEAWPFSEALGHIEKQAVKHKTRLISKEAQVTQEVEWRSPAG